MFSNKYCTINSGCVRTFLKMLYEVYNIERLAVKVVSIAGVIDIRTYTLAAKYIHHKNKGEEHFHPEMGN